MNKERERDEPAQAPHEREYVFAHAPENERGIRVDAAGLEPLALGRGRLVGLEYITDREEGVVDRFLHSTFPRLGEAPSQTTQLGDRVWPLGLGLALDLLHEVAELGHAITAPKRGLRTELMICTIRSCGLAQTTTFSPSSSQ